MKDVILKENKSYYLNNKIFIVKSGKVKLKVKTRKIIYEKVFNIGNIIYNFFLFLPSETYETQKIEVIALEENTILTEIAIDEKELKENRYLRIILYSLLKNICEDYLLRIEGDTMEEVKTDEFIKFFKEKELKEKYEKELGIAEENSIDNEDLEGVFYGEKQD